MSTSSMPSPPRRGRAAAKQPRRSLSREGIVDAAIAIVDARGLDAVSMRSVADALGTGPASLYAHVANKDELLTLMIERLAGEMEMPAPDPERWQEQIKAIVREMHSIMLAHRDVARAALANIPVGEPVLKISNGMIAVLEHGDLPPQVIAYATDLLTLYATAMAYERSLYNERLNTEEGARYFEEVAEYFAALPPERFPHLSALAGFMSQGDAGERFEFGLDVIVAGIAAYGRRASTA